MQITTGRRLKKRSLETLTLLTWQVALTWTRMPKTMHQLNVSQRFGLLATWNCKRFPNNTTRKGFTFSFTLQLRISLIFVFFQLLHIRANCVCATPLNATNKRFYVVEFLWDDFWCSKKFEFHVNNWAENVLKQTELPTIVDIVRNLIVRERERKRKKKREIVVVWWKMRMNSLKFPLKNCENEFDLAFTTI